MLLAQEAFELQEVFSRVLRMHIVWLHELYTVICYIMLIRYYTVLFFGLSHSSKLLILMFAFPSYY